MKYLTVIVILLFGMLLSCKTENKRILNHPKETIYVKEYPKKENVWVFLMAGQSNMVGRAFVSPSDTIPNHRILSINSKNKLIEGKEPLHFYEPNASGLDCGMSFGREVLSNIPDSISILILPTAVGGSSIEKWINDKTFRKVKLLTNFTEKVEIGKKYGKIKGILWHQGENDAKTNSMNYQNNLTSLLKVFRKIVDNNNLPILIGELGKYNENNEKWQEINDAIHNYVKSDTNSMYIKTQDLKDKGDKLHFDAESQRIMGKRFAKSYLKISKSAHNKVYKSLGNK